MRGGAARESESEEEKIFLAAANHFSCVVA